jgi:hypothetical protein
MNGDRLMIQDLARRVRALEDRLSPPEDAPKPPTLREQVAQAWCAEFYGETSPSIGQGAADAVLTVVADWLAAQPVHDGTAAGLWALEPRLAQRANDVRLLRGES